MDRPADIVYVIPRPEIGGAEKQLLRLIERLDPRAYRATVICLDGGGSLLDAYRDAAHEVVVLGRHGLFDLATFAKLLGHIRRIRPVAVHATLYIANLYGGWAGRLAGVPTVVVSQRGLGIDPRHSRLKRFTHALLNGFIGQFADTRAVNSLAVADRMAEYGWTDCRVIYNGTLDLPYPRRQALATLRRALEIPAGSSILTAVSRIDPKKDLVTLLRAFRRVVSIRRDTYLLIAGDGFEDYRRALVQEAHRLDIADLVRFLGFRDDVADLIALGDVSVLSSITEGLPNAVLESMLLARPVVATRVGGVPELVDHGVEGYLVDPGDHGAFASRVLDLLGNPERSRAMGTFGRARALSDFGVDAVLTRTTALYGHPVRNRAPQEIRLDGVLGSDRDASPSLEWARLA